MDLTGNGVSHPPASAEAFLDSSIDYAGLFPPARLGLEDALSDYLNHLSEPQLARYLGCFVIPIGLLPDASTWLKQRGVAETAKLRCSVLAGPAEESDSVVAAVRRFESSLPGARVEMFELKTTATPGEDQSEGEPLLSGIVAAFRGESRHVFVELDWRRDSSPAMDSLAGKGVGVKLRTGGLTPDLVPPPAAVARFLRGAAQFRLPVKFTAGLHVPVPNNDPAVGARMHGFLNIMSAAMAAHRENVSTEALVQILERPDYPDFEFDAEGLRAGVLRFDVDEIRRLRRYVRGFGSCSFLEPLEHLARHGLLPPLPQGRESLAR